MEPWRRNSANYKDRFISESEFYCKENKIIIKPSGEANNCIWDASIVLGKFLEYQDIIGENWVKGRRVIEIGAGE